MISRFCLVLLRPVEAPWMVEAALRQLANPDQLEVQTGAIASLHNQNLPRVPATMAEAGTQLALALTKIDESFPDQQTRNYRILRALLEYAPSERGRQNVAREIISCETALEALADRYIANLLVPMKGEGGKTPYTSLHPSRPSAEVDAEQIASELEYARRQQYAIKGKTLERDAYRCIATGMYDELADIDADKLPTIAAHIIPFFYAPTDESSAQLRKSSTLFETLQSFSGSRIIHQLNGPDINRLGNALTLTQHIHSYFGKLKLSFEAVPNNLNTYRIRTHGIRTLGVYDGKQVILTSTNPQHELPIPELLAIHHACAKVIHACGLSDTIERWLRDIEGVSVLSRDGSSESVAVLQTALQLAVRS